MCDEVKESTLLKIKDLRVGDAEDKKDTLLPQLVQQGASDAVGMATQYTGPPIQRQWTYALRDFILSRIKPFNEKEKFQNWLLCVKFFLEEVPKERHSRMLLMCLSPEHLSRALHANLASNTPLDSLCERLQHLLQPKMPIGEAIDRLIKRRCRRHETPSNFAQDLSDLVDAAYPSLTVSDKEAVVLHHFIKGLYMPDLIHSLIVMPPTNIQDAVARAERFQRVARLQWLNQPSHWISNRQAYRPNTERVRHTTHSEGYNCNSRQAGFYEATTTTPPALE
ncbi:unnamed protein product [Dibothriocephalus latus]|uniref:Uncharacterized protein n=1 Tax=Dibothriocephalus latus TaxID=60516 RepID=A0A3P6TPH7_DIBLA|nr:unnamed protein product [Dibothriocephalus latus]